MNVKKYIVNLDSGYVYINSINQIRQHCSNIRSIYENTGLKYRNKVRTVSQPIYYLRKMRGAIERSFKTEFVKALAFQYVNRAQFTIYLDASDVGIEKIKSLPCVKSVVEYSPKKIVGLKNNNFLNEKNYLFLEDDVPINDIASQSEPGLPEPILPTIEPVEPTPESIPEPTQEPNPEPNPEPVQPTPELFTPFSDNKYTLDNLQPNNNFGLITQNSKFFNLTVGSEKVFSSAKDPMDTIYEYKSNTPDKPIDVLVIDNGVYAEHLNFTRIVDDTKINICQTSLDINRNLPWRLCNLYSLCGIDFEFDDTTIEGVNIDDPKYTAYYRPKNIENPDDEFNHGTHIAGIVCGSYTGWLRGKNVRLHSIPLLNMQSDPFMEIFLELAVIDFQINKILNNDFTPTIINRSYAAYLQYDNVELFSNFDMTINNNSLVFSLTDNNFSIHPNSEYILDYNGFLCLEKQLGIVNCFAGGNNNELQLRHSTEIDSFYNKYNKITIDDYPNEYALYPYRHSYAMLSKSFYKLNGYSIDEIVSSEQLVNFPDTGFYVDYPAINEFILKENIGYLDSYKLMDPEISVILVGSMGASSDSYNSITYTMNHIGLPYFKHYAISSFSCIGDALIYGQGSPVFSSVLTKNVDLYDIYSGTSMATPNILGLIGDYVLNLTDTINPFGLKSKVTNYVETSVINFNNICNNDERRLVLMTEPLKNGINTYGLTSLAFDIEKAIYPFNNQVPIKFREFKYRVLIK